MVDAETFERLRAELLAELVAVDLLGEDPLVETVGVVFRAEGLAEPLLLAALVDDLFRCEVGDEFVDVRVVALGGVKLARRDVEEGYAGGLAAEVDGCKIGVLLIRQEVFSHYHAGCDKLDYATLDEPLDLLGVFELFAYRHAFARSHELGHIGVYGMVRKSGQLDIRCRSVGAPRKRDA